MSDDPFAIFGLDRQFAIDTQALRQAFLRLSSAHHPDGFVDPLEQAEAVEKMSQLTESYRVLDDPEQRARALLALSGLELDDDKDKLPPDLLMEVMDVREAMEDAIASSNQTELARLRVWAHEQREYHLQQIAKLFEQDLNASKALPVRLQLNALRYMQRMIEQMPE